MRPIIRKRDGFWLIFTDPLSDIVVGFPFTTLAAAADAARHLWSQP